MLKVNSDKIYAPGDTINYQNVKLIRPLKWEEVFLFWYQNEGDKQNWIDLAKQRGFASWAEWRLKGYAERFACDKAEWGLYELNNPTQIVPQFNGGPFRTWIERHYDGAREKTFAELAKQKEITEIRAIQKMIADFPIDKIITCLQLKDKIYTIEGMHRCCALAVMNEKKILGPDKLLFAIGKSKLNELPKAGKVG